MAVHYGRDEVAAKETVEAITGAGGRAFAVRAELGVPGDVDTLFAALEPEIDGLDILVNNAGVNASASIEELTPELYDRVYAVNVKAPLFIIQRALPLMRDGGRIVNITSGVTRIALPGTIAYTGTKGAIEVMGRTLAKQLGPRGITVNSVAPGFVDTDINADWLRGDPEAQAYAAGFAALGRVGTPEDVADVVAFVTSADARWVTGTTLDATGGSAL
ncbi:SDR family oxidoreductase [Streptosporangium sandarakinum]|uniref:NAD(P)-dependent dehydrogenase (Short-subunit alcohol dehydrogenase family) n=1 Tax=Streptosporangium sandarakinum TaxID=1260955 RepID=A0A852V651_9ACTN|nr:SDR family oxidoreductase [Streptosporangium sandarakinum]NYF43058.1 NAD(P)-dependent dehydrogenase (short-subunit alcohol dehydrogenase family) [Streptosporangium sandarakinum]